jgi:hypothetical protein
MTFTMPIADALAVLKNYSPMGDYSLAKGVPMAYLDSVRKAVKSVNPGRRVRIRYRGSRTNPLDTRHRVQRYQDCLKQFATTFAVYVD